jgi:hypothetical protein
MAGVITTGSIPKALWPAVFAFWGLAYENASKMYPMLFDVEQSRKNFEELVSMAGLGLFRQKPEGQGIQYDDMRQGAVTRAYNLTYASGYIITEEMLEDNQYPQDLNKLGKDAGRDLGEKALKTIETLAANVYNRAFNNAYTFGDGVTLLNSAHPEAKGLSFSNIPTVGADMSEVSLEQANIDIKRYKDAAGTIISLKGESLIVPPELEFEANRILESVLQNNSNTNALNALKATGAFPKGIIVNPYLTDAKAWFIRTNVTSGKGLVAFERIKPEVKPDNDFDTGNAKFKCRFRMSFTNGDPRSIYGSPGV